LASAKAIKAYVDNGLSSLSSTTITEGETSVVVADSGTGSITLTADGNTELVVNDTSATFSGNVVVTGDLTVNGTTTTVATTNTVVSDSLMELANGTTGAPANDSGIVIERGDSNNAFIGFDESEDKFKMGTGTFTGASTGNLTITTGTLVANLEGTATAAEYSDVAERFAADTAYEPGTVVALGGAAEITQVNEEASDEVFGVVSSLQQAAFKMNGGAGNDETHPYIAMTGRVNVKVIGTVNKGDRLISASVPGYAKAATKAECTAFNVIGRALTSKTETGQGSVLAAVRVSH
jgi:lipopolysaccharide export system protein LptA